MAGPAGTSALEQLWAWATGGGAVTPGVPGGKVGSVFVDGGLFHTTPTGQRRPNTASLMVDPISGAPGFFLHAGNPSGWSKWSRKRPRHHHAHSHRKR